MKTLESHLICSSARVDACAVVHETILVASGFLIEAFNKSGELLYWTLNGDTMMQFTGLDNVGTCYH